MRVASILDLPVPFSLRFASTSIVLILAALCPACSSGRKPVYAVKGQVLVDGKPAANAQVLFHPTEGTGDELRPTGQTDDDGYFTLTSYVKGDGAPEGNYHVTVTWFRVYQARNQPNGEVQRYNALPQRYAQATTSPLHATVNKGDTELVSLQLGQR